jgi:CRP-like cAMP-binding protein
MGGGEGRCGRYRLRTVSGYGTRSENGPFLDSAGVARRVKPFKRAEIVYTQGDAAKSVLYLQEAGVKLSVVSEVGKEAVVAILGPGDFFGEGCLAGQTIRMGTATAITPSTVLVIEKERNVQGASRAA